MAGRIHSFIRLFARHPVAANLLMVLMFLSGIAGYQMLKTELLPQIELPFIIVSVVWPGASIEDVESNLTLPIEKQLQSIDGLKSMQSSSFRNFMFLFIEFNQEEDLTQAVNLVKRQISSMPGLPSDIEPATVNRIEIYDTVARLIISGGQDREELRQLAFELRNQLLDNGFVRVTVEGLGTNELSIDVPQDTLTQLNVDFTTLGNQIISRNLDASGGAVGRDDLPQQLRIKDQRESVIDAESIVLNLNNAAGLLQLDDIADLIIQPKEGEVVLYTDNKPVVELRLYRSFSQDTIALSQRMNNWLALVKKKLPEGVSLQVYDERWKLIDQRLGVLIRNASIGFILVFISLAIFLNIRTAFWVALGIPTAYFGSLLVLGAFGLTINMLTIFAFIITIGIVVDDAIVVGEETATQYSKGKSALDAAIIGAERMFTPVVCSSLTTISALLPLFVIGGFVGALIIEIPLAIVCVIIASLIECFLILPGHLHHSLKHMKKPSKFRLKLDKAFNGFRDGPFRSFITACISARYIVISIVGVMMLLTIGLIRYDIVQFSFLPITERSIISQVVNFAQGTSPERKREFMNTLQQSLYKTSKDAAKKGKDVVVASIVYMNTGVFDPRQGVSESRASIAAELVDTDERSVSNKEFIEQWKENYSLPPDVESVTVREQRYGPSSADIQLILKGANYTVLKAAATAVQQKLSAYEGVSNVVDNLNYGQEELIFTLTDQAKGLGLTSENIAWQLNQAFSGRQLKVINLPNQEIEVKLGLSKVQRGSRDNLDHFPIMINNQEALPFHLVMNTKVSRGFGSLTHTDGMATVEVQADVDEEISNRNLLVEQLKKEVVPQIESQYGVQAEFAGVSVEQLELFRDMQYGALIGIALIYIIMAWVFGSYVWPFAILIAIPFGFVGAVFGHLVMGYDISSWSLFGFFALSGIVVNDSIILILRYKQLKQKLVANKAIIEACCQRLRAVVLTSLTTIAGLLPAMFDTSLSTQFLVPIAITMVFGMAFATVLTLIFIPVLLAVFDRIDKAG